MQLTDDSTTIPLLNLPCIARSDVDILIAGVGMTFLDMQNSTYHWTGKNLCCLQLSFSLCKVVDMTSLNNEQTPASLTGCHSTISTDRFDQW